MVHVQSLQTPRRHGLKSQRAESLEAEASSLDGSGLGWSEARMARVLFRPKILGLRYLSLRVNANDGSHPDNGNKQLAASVVTPAVNCCKGARSC